MNDSDFWSTIALLNWDRVGDDAAVVEPVVKHLAKLANEEIFQFEEFMARKLHLLDTEAHARNAGEYAYDDSEEFFSVDAFLYARCVVVANGSAFFEAVLADPSNFPQDMEFEALLYLAQQAFELKNNSQWDYVAPTNYETFQNADGWR